MNLMGALKKSIPLMVFGYLCLASWAQIPRANARDEVFVKSFTIPEYRPVARLAHVQGDVSAIVHINADGSTASISDIEGPALLQGQAVEALKTWTFFNAMNQPTEFKVTFRWKLEGPGTDQYVPAKVSGQFPGLIEIATNPPAPLEPDWIKAPQKKP